MKVRHGNRWSDKLWMTHHRKGSRLGWMGL